MAVWWIGADEAGYGPRLGPLVVVLSSWKMADERHDPYEVLGDYITPEPQVGKLFDPHRLWVADSKAVYRAGKSPDKPLGRLELPVLAFHSASASIFPETLSDLAFDLDRSYVEQRIALPWQDLERYPIPAVVAARDVGRWSRRLTRAFRETGCALRGLAAKIVLPRSFNERLGFGKNKAAVLTEITFDLIHKVLTGIPKGEAVRITCDKHGGRKFYVRQVYDEFTPDWVNVQRETRDSSLYSWTDAERHVRLECIARAERFPPVALASMAAKYLRELFMRAWNDFWLQHVPSLRATAGYPLDARRFLREIAVVQQSLRIPVMSIWRNA